MKKTISSRISIGFPENTRDWKTEKITLSTNELKIAGHPVMEAWEKPYMEELAKIATLASGDVLEVGFGMGISARLIQEYPIRSHTIIEANDEVVREAESFKTNAKVETRILNGFWEDVTKNLSDGSFDGILFDTYPLLLEEVHCNHYKFFPTAYRLLREGGVLTYYSDESKSFSIKHLDELKNAGFSNIDSYVVGIETPDECSYWNAKTFLVPVITR